MKQHSSAFDRVKSILMQEVDWAHIGFSKNNNKKLQELYHSWAERYDEEMPRIDYNYTEPMKAAFVRSNIKTDSKILDAACGTGYPTMALYEMGYRDLHGIDFSSEMLVEAKKKNIYKSLTVANLIDPIDFATDTFDVVMCIGFLASGHMGPEPLDEFIRVTKPNGYLICSIGVNIFDRDGFDKKLQQLQDDNIIEIDHASDPFLVVPEADFGTAKSKIWSIKKL
jgi:ubiquinone/menaquinone biosynthesis C-methylase UbiE